MTALTRSEQIESIEIEQVIELHNQATELLDKIIQANGGKVPYDCAANVVLECYQRLNVPEGSIIQQGQFNGWTKESGLSQRTKHVWLKVNSYTIIDPLAEQFRDNNVLVNPFSYEVERNLSLEELQSLDSFCDDFEEELDIESNLREQSID